MRSGLTSSITVNHFPVTGGSVLKKKTIELLVADLNYGTGAEYGWKAKKDLVAVGTDAVEPVIEAVRTGNANVVFFGAMVLGEIGDNRAVPALIEMLEQESSDGDVKLEIAEALGRIGDPRAFVPLINSWIYGNWRIKDEFAPCDEQIMEVVFWALKKIGKIPLDPITNGLRADTPEARRRAAELLIQFPRKAATDRLLETVDDPDKIVRHKCVIALGCIKDKKAVASLERKLKDDMFAEVRSAAAGALGRTRNPESVPALVSAMMDPDHSVRRSAANALHRLSWKPQTTGERVRYNIAHQRWDMVVSGYTASIEPLVYLLKNGSLCPKDEIIKTLGEIRDADAVPALTESIEYMVNLKRRNWYHHCCIRDAFIALMKMPTMSPEHAATIGRLMEMYLLLDTSRPYP